jgi:heme/copper-type cytochrome/quinol oxidase subunit 2
MEGSFSTGQSPQWAVVPVEEEEEEEEEEEVVVVVVVVVVVIVVVVVTGVKIYRRLTSHVRRSLKYK